MASERESDAKHFKHIPVAPLPPEETADNLVRGWMDPPLTVADLIKRLEIMEPSTQVFIVEVGNKEGSIKWKRKETYKQWANRCVELKN